MTLAAGSRLGPYELMSPLGAGGMGEVWKARDTRLSREVAIKVLPAGVSSDRDRLKRFEKEARSASSLNHPNIVTIHDIGTGPSGAYIAMEWIDGQTLRELLSEGSLPTRRLLSIGAQMADGLAKAHGAGIIHRDLKPENVMVTRDGFVKILDFGLAKLTEPEDSTLATHAPTVSGGTEPGLVMGTVGYMSPEQALGKPLDFRTDQFSLGAILYEMVTGRRAFARASTPETLSAIIRDEPEPMGTLAPARTPPPLRWMVERCLAKKAEDRYASTRDLARDLSTIKEHLSEASGGVAGVASPPRSWPLAAAFGVIVAVAALAGGILLGPLLGSGRRPPLPKWHQLSFRRGMIWSGRFASDGQTIVYSAAWDGAPVRLFTTRTNATETRELDLPPGKVLSVSPRGELAFLRDPRFVFFFFQPGTLARSSLEGAAARDLLENAVAADWSPDGAELAVVRALPGKDRLEYPIGRTLYETEAAISDVRVSRDGAWIAFFEHPNDTATLVAVRVADRSRRILSEGWSISSGGLAWSSDGRELWFTPRSRSDRALPLFAVNLSGKRREVTTVPAALQLLDIAPDGRVLLARCDFRLGMRAASGGGTDRDLSFLDNGFLGDLSADGRTIVFTDHSGLFVRRTDGSPPVRLGEPYRFGLNRLSPDGKWVLAVPASEPARLVLVPTGAGEVRRLDNIPENTTAEWFPDGKRLLCTSIQPAGTRLFVFDLQSGEVRDVSVPANLPFPRSDAIVSRDGTRIAALDGNGDVHILPLDGGRATRVPSGVSGFTLIGWAGDGRHLYLYRIGDVPGAVHILDIVSGKMALWRKLTLEDLAGVIRIHPIQVTPDGRSWAFSYARVLSDLYVVEGLK